MIKKSQNRKKGRGRSKNNKWVSGRDRKQSSNSDVEDQSDPEVSVDMHELKSEQKKAKEKLDLSHQRVEPKNDKNNEKMANLRYKIKSTQNLIKQKLTNQQNAEM